MDLIQQKKQLRKQMSQIRNSISEEDRIRKSESIVEYFMNLPEVKEANTIYVYVSYESEVNTMGLLTRLWERGKCVAAPRVHRLQKTMDFYEITSMSDLEKGYCGILEPRQLCELARSADVVVMPGLAFDKNGHRLGYGGGYYDIYWSNENQKNVFAFAFAEQVIAEVPVGNDDVMIDKVITDKGIMK